MIEHHRLSVIHAAGECRREEAGQGGIVWLSSRARLSGFGCVFSRALSAQITLPAIRRSSASASRALAIPPR